MARKPMDDLLPETAEVVALVTIHTGGSAEGFKPGSRLTLSRVEAEDMQKRGLVAWPGEEIVGNAGKAGSFEVSALKTRAGGADGAQPVESESEEGESKEGESENEEQE